MRGLGAVAVALLKSQRSRRLPQRVGLRGRDLGVGRGDVHIDALQSKVVIAHEIGYAVMYKVSGKGAPGCADDAGDAACPEIARDGSANTEHSLTSSEQHGCAVGEGCAHFYAAAVFNNGDQKDAFNNTDCDLRYYKIPQPGSVDWSAPIDCEVGTASYPDSYYANVCDTRNTGRSTGLDWMRTFWGFVTDNGWTQRARPLTRHTPSLCHWQRSRNGYAVNSGLAT